MKNKNHKNIFDYNNNIKKPVDIKLVNTTRGVSIKSTT